MAGAIPKQLPPQLQKPSFRHPNPRTEFQRKPPHQGGYNQNPQQTVNRYSEPAQRKSPYQESPRPNNNPQPSHIQQPTNPSHQTARYQPPPNSKPFNKFAQRARSEPYLRPNFHMEEEAYYEYYDDGYYYDDGECGYETQQCHMTTSQINPQSEPVQSQQQVEPSDASSSSNQGHTTEVDDLNFHMVGEWKRTT